MFTNQLFGGLLPFAVLPLLGLALLVSSIGFKKYVYFISIGYGYSIAAISVFSLVFAGQSASLATWLLCLLLIVYGLRLGTYLAIREAKPSYRASQASDGDRQAPLGFGVKLSIWITVALLYVIMFMPMIQRLSAEARGLADPLPLLGYVGAAVSALGICLESLADAQKSAAKKKAPKRFCDSGLYRITRCPNYFGELLVWTGSMIAGLSLLGSWLAWVLALVGYLSIVLIMIGSARRLEIKQEERYGKDPEFQAYVRKVPVLLPLLPIYSLKNAKIYLG